MQAKKRLRYKISLLFILAFVCMACTSVVTFLGDRGSTKYFSNKEGNTEQLAADTNSNIDFGKEGIACEENKELVRKCVECNTASVTYSNENCSTYSKHIQDPSCSNLCPKPVVAEKVPQALSQEVQKQTQQVTTQVQNSTQPVTQTQPNTSTNTNSTLETCKQLCTQSFTCTQAKDFVKANKCYELGLNWDNIKSFVTPACFEKLKSYLQCIK